MVAILAATFIAAIPTRLSSHDVAVGRPFRWHSRQEIITLGERLHNFSLGLLLLDVVLVLAVFVAVRIAVRKLIHKR
jgi:membrane protein required for beta-lactamase induction